MAFIPIAMMAYDCYVDKVYYNLNTSDKTASVTNNGYGSYSGSVTIPSSFWYNGIKYSMTSIEDYAFNGSSYLTSITIPSSVTSIGNSAFESCSKLTSITIPSSVTSIGVYAFNNCSGLNSISVASGNIYFDSRNYCNAIIEKSTNTLIAGCKKNGHPQRRGEHRGLCFLQLLRPDFHHHPQQRDEHRE